MRFHVFGHIQTNHAVIRTKQLLSKRLAQFGFSHAGWPEKEEGGAGTVRVIEPDTGASDCPRDRLNRLRLADDALGKVLLQLHELTGLYRLRQGARHQRRDLDSGSLRDDLCNILHRHTGLFSTLLTLTALGKQAQFLQGLRFSVPQRGSKLKILSEDGSFLLLVQLPKGFLQPLIF